MSRRALDEFTNQKLAAKRILSSKGEKTYQWWLANVYEYPFEPIDKHYDGQYERAPLTREEEQKIIDRRDRRLGRPLQGRLSGFVVAAKERPKPRKRKSAEPGKRPGKQSRVEQFFAPRSAVQSTSSAKTQK